MDIKKGDVLYFKGKYGIYREVVVISVEGERALVKGDDFIFGTQKVRIDKLVKKKPKSAQKFDEELEKELQKMQEKLYYLKDNLA